MRLNSLASRLFATSVAWTLVVLPIAGFLIDQRYFNEKQAEFDARLKRTVEQINIESFGNGTSEPQTPVNRLELVFETTLSGWYWQIQPVDGRPGARLVSASLATAALPSPYQQNVLAESDRYRWLDVRGPTGELIRICEVIDSLGRLPGETRYSILVSGPLDWVTDPVGKFRTWLVSALALAGLALVAVTWLQVGFGLLPLRRIEQGLAGIRSGGATRLDGELPAEIEPLQVELNALIQSNQDIVDRARTQVGNLAHALKTPLAVIVNEAREEKSPFGSKVAEQASLMRDQINHYLDRARIAARAGVIGRVTPIGETIEPLARAIERLYRDKGVRIVVQCPSEARFQGEKHDLEEMLGGLLDNACQWARERVFLTVSPPPEDGPEDKVKGVVIDIEDDGPGLSEEQRAYLGKRGTRLDETKPGSGLGLSIVKDLARSYRGSFTLAASRHGGLLARLELPAA